MRFENLCARWAMLKMIISALRLLTDLYHCLLPCILHAPIIEDQ
jgi:hypothetical protein